MDAREVRRLEQVLLKRSLPTILWCCPRQPTDELSRVLNQLGQQRSLQVVGDGHQALKFGSNPVGIAVRLHEPKDVLDPWCPVLGPDAQRVTVCVQTTCPKAFDVGAQKISLLVVGGVLRRLGELGAQALEVDGVISTHQLHDSASIWEREALVEIAVVDGRKYYPKVTTILCFANPCVFGEDGIPLEDLGHHLNIVLRYARTHVVCTLCDFAGITEAVRRKGLDRWRYFSE